MKLINPDEDTLNSAFAERVAGWRDVRYEEGEEVDIEARSIYPWEGLAGFPPDGQKRRLIPRFTRSMDAVLPWLEKWNESWEISFYNGTWNISVESPKGPMLYGWVKDTSLPLACCLALLRANGVEVEFTK